MGCRVDRRAEMQVDIMGLARDSKAEANLVELDGMNVVCLACNGSSS
jgi:hypothetical protein